MTTITDLDLVESNETTAEQQNLTEEIRGLMRGLLSAAQIGTKALATANAEFASRQRGATSRHEQACVQIDSEYTSESTARARAFETAKARRTEQFEEQHQAIERHCHEAIERTTHELKAAEAKALRTHHEAVWLARTVYEAKRDQLNRQLHEMKKSLRVQMQAAARIKDAADSWLVTMSQTRAARGDAELPVSLTSDPKQQLGASLGRAQQCLQQLQQLQLPNLVQPGRLTASLMALSIALVAGAGWLSGWRPVPWGILSVLCVAGLVVTGWQLRRVAHRQVKSLYEQLLSATLEVDDCSRDLMRLAVSVFQRERTKTKSLRHRDTRRADKARDQILAACRKRRDDEIPAFATEAGSALNLLQQEYERDYAAIVAEHETHGPRLTRERESRLDAARLEFEREHKSAQLDNTQQCQQIRSRWEANVGRAKLRLAAIDAELDASCPGWNAEHRTCWQQDAASAIRIGRLAVDALTPDGASTRLSVPATIDLPTGFPISIAVESGGAPRATDLMRLIMLRLLTAFPPGKLRVTIIDPVTLGQNFSGFMHLADHDAALVSQRVWTDPVQIEQQLVELGEHIETVIQKYLRDEFASIEAYNSETREIAEPYRLLVITDFPHGFSDNAIRRLQAVIQSGPRCGVFTLISADARMLRGRERKIDLGNAGSHFTARADRVVSQDPSFARLRLEIDSLPTATQCKDFLHLVGKAAARTKRVEVPFETIAPPSTQYWATSSRDGIDLPLGRTSATRLQHLRLGQGTAQHVLISGKTGSGKSTLLHALITNAALRYSPEELELYLIDFKKGVEFKTYVTHQLPHARVIAIESEREFGLSVMQRLDREMYERGELFREAGVQDIAGYRRSGQQLPRVLFIVDEFQEFFVDDDKLAQETALLLDRLVRQGRAFGIHVHLGSQTLGGAYTLARTTLGQMAVRIALQCSEADAHLILSEDNAAARLLTRPGEAIYNDANGFVEGNHSFQAVWLSDERREFYLRKIQDLNAESHSVGDTRRTVVFEGMRPVSLAQNEEVQALFAQQTDAKQHETPRAFLGEPIAIQEATAAQFERRAGANLLLLGQNADATSGMLVSSVVSLLSPGGSKASEPEATSPSIWVLDGSAGNAAHRFALNRLAEASSGGLHLADADQATEVIDRLATEIEYRRTGPGKSSENRPTFLVVAGLWRIDQLRRVEDEFSFSRESQRGTDTASRFAEILEQGPALGIHTLLACDTLTTLQRMLGRQALRQFALRVLLQMSASDSSVLIDRPISAELGPHRALFHRETEGRLDKFRPFAVPDDEWLAWACQRLREREY